MSKSFKISDFSTLENQFKDSIERFDKTFKKSLDILADYGWYTSGEMTLGKILEGASSGVLKRKNDVDNLMRKYYSKEKKNIIKKLLISFPARKAIINEASACHDKKLYAASTILFLSLADGIFSGTLLTTKKKNLRKTLIELDHSEYVLEVLTKVRGIDDNNRKKHKYNSDLNRHEIMHGFSSDYGTELNSLKALSLVIFIADDKDRLRVDSDT